MSILSDLFFDYRVDVWRQTIQKDVHGVVKGKSWGAHTSAVACYKEPLTSTQAAGIAGRIEADNMFSMDYWFFEPGVDIQAGDMLQSRTLHEDGTETLEFGQWWVVRGQAQAFESLGLMDLGHNVFLASKQKIGPEGTA